VLLRPNEQWLNLWRSIWLYIFKARTNRSHHIVPKIISYLPRCFQQKENELWNAAGVAFYEHLGDNEETLKEMSAWVKPTIYTNIRGLLALRLGESEIEKLDQMYGVKPMKY